MTIRKTPTKRVGQSSVGFRTTHFGYSEADPFMPHSFETKLVSKNHAEPTILITPEAYSDMYAIAKNAGSNEIGWLGTVSELGNNRFLIDGIYMPAQEVHGATCELTEDGLGECFTELATSDFDACERMLFWGHVHPANSTSPSLQDENQMELFDHNDWFIRGIFGRRGRAEFTFFDYKNNIQWNDVPWMIYHPVDNVREEKWKEEIEEKVTEIPSVPYHRKNLSNNSFNNLNTYQDEEEDDDDVYEN